MSDGLDRTRLPMPDPPFAGSAGRMIGDSEPDWGIIGDVEPPAGSPNILLVLIDDAGFGRSYSAGVPSLSDSRET